MQKTVKPKKFRALFSEISYVLFLGVLKFECTLIDPFEVKALTRPGSYPMARTKTRTRIRTRTGNYTQPLVLVISPRYAHAEVVVNFFEFYRNWNLWFWGFPTVWYRNIWFRKVREVCRIHFHLVAPVKYSVVTSYDQKNKNKFTTINTTTIKVWAYKLSLCFL